MQIVLENASIDVALVPPTAEAPEGAIVIVARDGYVTMPLSLPKLTALGMAHRIIDVCNAEANGRAVIEIPGRVPAAADEPAEPESDAA